MYKSSELLKQQRDKLVQQKIVQEEMELQQECTFRPDLATKHAPVYQQSSSKFSIIVDKPQETIPYELRDCTFTPKVGCASHHHPPLLYDDDAHDV